MTKEEKKIHDLQFEVGQLRLRVEDDETHIKKLMDDLENANKNFIGVMMANEIALRVLNNIVDDVMKLKEGQK